MKKKRMRILALLLAGVMLIALAVPAALAEGAENGSSGAAQTETTRQESGQHRGRTESGRPGEGSGKDLTVERTHGHSSHKKHSEPEAPENAIDKDAAKETALADAGFTSEQVGKVRCRLSDRDGTLVYKVSFRLDGQKYSYKLDPVSGEILDKTVSEAKEHAVRRSSSAKAALFE